MEHLSDIRPGLHPPHGATVDEHRHEHERLVLGGIIEERSELLAPRCHRAHEEGVGRTDPVLVGTEPATHQNVGHRRGDRREVVANHLLITIGMVEPRDRAVDIRAWQRLSTGLAAKSQPGEPHRRRASLCDSEIERSARERVGNH